MRRYLVPETIMSSKTANISQFCEIGWYKWVKFCSSTLSFPEDLLVLGKDLGPLIDVDHAMTAKILNHPQSTGKVIHHSTYRPLMPEELTSPVKQDPMNIFLHNAEE